LGNLGEKGKSIRGKGLTDARGRSRGRKGGLEYLRVKISKILMHQEGDFYNQENCLEKKGM